MNVSSPIIVLMTEAGVMEGNLVMNKSKLIPKMKNIATATIVVRKLVMLVTVWLERRGRQRKTLVLVKRPKKRRFKSQLTD